MRYSDSATDILLADDDADFLAMIQPILEQEGLSVATASDGVQALDCIREQSPKLVVLDSMLPLMNGYECLCAIKAEPDIAGTHVMMCSGHGDLDYAVSCAEAGAEAFIHKPFESEYFVQRVQRILQLV